MSTEDRIYFARRAAEEQERAAAATSPEVAQTHRKLQRAYLERACVGERPHATGEIVAETISFR